jgi:hypothetical protein
MFLSPFGGRVSTLAILAGSALVAVVTGCETRDRLPFPSGGGTDQVGPITLIDDPSKDTTVVAGPGVFVNGRTIDNDGIDTIYIETEGGVTSFPPFIRVGNAYRFGLPITTNRQSGATITVRVFGTDLLGNRGDTATRQITVQ